MYEAHISSDWLEKLQQAGLRPYLWLEGLILAGTPLNVEIEEWTISGERAMQSLQISGENKKGEGANDCHS